MGGCFFAYPAEPKRLGQTIEAAAAVPRGGRDVHTWKELDVPGHFIATEVLEGIQAASVLVADITRLNFNVTFEVGFGIGSRKRVLLVQNASLSPAREDLSRLGIFDTLGWKAYENAEDLAKFLSEPHDPHPLRLLEQVPKGTAPVYLLEPFHKDDAAVHTLSRLKKTRLNFRSHDPTEQSRLPAGEAIQNVVGAEGVILRLLSNEHTDHEIHNLRVAFVAGLAHGLGKELLILQEPADPVPLDYRDLVQEFRDNQDIERHISEFAPRVVEKMQARGSGTVAPPSSNLLERLSLGASAAENEFTELKDYYVRTDEFRRTVRGEARIAVGRKGTGKSALFFQARDAVRGSKQNVVLDLKPEGHQFKRLRDSVLARIDGTSQEHLATAFWEYLLTLELASKVLQSDRQRHLHHPELLEPYQALGAAFQEGEVDGSGDFSERILALVQRLADDFPAMAMDEGKLSSGAVAQLLYRHDLPRLQTALRGYLHHKQDVWIVVDNLDKGWPTRGLAGQDVMLIRGLLDATRKMERHFAHKGVSLRTVVFLRNDVFELLVNETPDRGKEARVSLDWTDRDRLRELIRRRVVATTEAFQKNTGFIDMWRTLCVSHVGGEETSEMLIELSLMRPRNLINLVEYCRSNAVNLGKDKIDADDIEKAVETYSHDMCVEISLEIRDVFPRVDDNALYAFLYAPATMTLDEVKARAGEHVGLEGDDLVQFVEILLWFSFLGVVVERGSGPEEHYCHTVQYDMKKLRTLARGLKDDTVRLCIHSAFRTFLETS